MTWHDVFLFVFALIVWGSWRQMEKQIEKLQRDVRRLEREARR